MSQQVKSNNQRIGEAVWAKAPKVVGLIWRKTIKILINLILFFFFSRFFRMLNFSPLPMVL